MLLNANVHSATQRMVNRSSDSAFIAEKKPDGFTALHLAAINNHMGVAKVLMQQVRMSIILLVVLLCFRVLVLP